MKYSPYGKLNHSLLQRIKLTTMSLFIFYKLGPYPNLNFEDWIKNAALFSRSFGFFWALLFLNHPLMLEKIKSIMINLISSFVFLLLLLVLLAFFLDNLLFHLTFSSLSSLPSLPFLLLLNAHKLFFWSFFWFTTFPSLYFAVSLPAHHLVRRQNLSCQIPTVQLS